MNWNTALDCVKFARHHDQTKMDILLRQRCLASRKLESIYLYSITTTQANNHLYLDCLPI